MDNNKPLHWSFNYNSSRQQNIFAKVLHDSLEEYITECQDSDQSVKEEGKIKHVYQILPNFWRGYKRNTENNNSFVIGEVIVERHRQNDKLWHYNVNYSNTTSGENLCLEFCCQNDNYRSLFGNWRVTAHNSCPDNYSNYRLTGLLSQKNEIRLNVNGIEISVETSNRMAPLMCNWSIFDLIPKLSETIKNTNKKESFCILDDLEQLRLNCKLGYLDSIDVPISLDGFYIYGTGLLPSYWWIDNNQNIAIVSSVFETLVLKEMTVSVQ